MGEELSERDLRPVVRLYTDGACIGNPGPGGWAFILEHPSSGRSKEESGGEHGTTNNRMEIMAVIKGLEALRRSSNVELFSDSRYVLNAIEGWMAKWKKFGWKRSVNARGLVKNADLWRRLDELLQRQVVKSQWVRGHDGHVENERCDEMAEAAAAKVAATPAPAQSAVGATGVEDLFSGPCDESEEYE